jgi:hypothetical protein
LDLLYIDFQYDDTAGEERPQVFKVGVSGASNSVAINTALTSALATNNIKETTGGLSNGRMWVSIDSANLAVAVAEPVNKHNWCEFLGFSRIDGQPMLRAYRQANTAGQYNYFSFDQSLNTFEPTGSIASQVTAVGSVATVAPVTITLVSALEDHIPGFSANWANTPAGTSAGAYPMDRAADDASYSGVIGPKISSKTIAVGTIEISSALRRTEIEDIKANTGMDIVQKMESILVNELSQTISKQIVSKIFEMGSLNRQSAPLSTAANAAFVVSEDIELHLTSEPREPDIFVRLTLHKTRNCYRTQTCAQGTQKIERRDTKSTRLPRRIVRRGCARGTW